MIGISNAFISNFDILIIYWLLAQQIFDYLALESQAGLGHLVLTRDVNNHGPSVQSTKMIW